jgi:L-aspartate oxidase
VIGVYVFSEQSGLIHTFLANAIVLATGGAGKVYRYTSNPHVATGDGVAMAYRAGARVGGLEFYQFHPTLLYHSKVNDFLISEALRGEGAYLRLPGTGERFMKRYAPKEMELATRDVVARAIFCEIEQGVDDYVHLDIRHKDKDFLQARFPMIYRTLLAIGLDLSRDLIPVVPAAHYMGGGIITDCYGQTDLKRLYAIGETACTGLHGANRLASNSLLEGVVMGRNTAPASLPMIKTSVGLSHPIRDWDSTSVVDLRRASQINVHWRGLRGEMSSYAGIIRTEAGLCDQLNLILARRQMIEDYYWKYTITRDLIELRNIILIAELIVRSALNRRESRGGHYREDFNTTQAESLC